MDIISLFDKIGKQLTKSGGWGRVTVGIAII